MAKDNSGTQSCIIVIVGIIAGTAITGSIWTLEEFVNSPRMVTSIGIWMLICFACIACIGAIINSIKGK